IYIAFLSVLYKSFDCLTCGRCCIVKILAERYVSYAVRRYEAVKQHGLICGAFGLSVKTIIERKLLSERKMEEIL
ncbi:MAG: hypothetical protein K2M82_03900, partial [Lachnospiraceae bacterium]|nr:hypothetical protein [Lachnospiraceae bacterium]